MQFKLRTLLLIVLLIAIPCAVFAFLEHEWFGPARTYAESQAKCEEIFAANGWQGHASAFHYDMRIRITSPDVGDVEIKTLYPILHEIPRLRYIELYATSLTDDGVAAMKREFPDCAFTVYDQWF
jgi:hypothetical protein